MGEGEPMGSALIDLELNGWQHAANNMRGEIDWHDLIIAAMYDQSGSIKLLNVLAEVL